MRRGGQGVLNVSGHRRRSRTISTRPIVELGDASTRCRRHAAPCDAHSVIEECRTQPARRRAPAAWTPRWFRSAAGRCRCRIRLGHHRRAHRLPKRRRRVRRVAPRHRARRGRRRRRAAAVGVHQRSRTRSRRDERSTRTCSTRPMRRCSTTSSSGGSTTRSSTSCPTRPTPTASARAIGGIETTHDRAILAVQGPRAKERLATVFPRRPQTSVASECQPGARGTGSTCVVAGTGYTGEAGVEIAVPAAAAADLWNAITAVGHHAGRPRRARHAAPRGSPAVARPRARARHHPLQAGLGWVVAWGEGRVPRPRGARRRTRARRRATAAGHRHRRSSPAACRLRRAGRRQPRSAWSPAATSRRCSSTASPWRSCRPTSPSRHRRHHRCPRLAACPAESSTTPFVTKHVTPVPPESSARTADELDLGATVITGPSKPGAQMSGRRCTLNRP